MKNKQVTIVQVAQAAGVSIATVSNVLNRRDVPLTEDTIRKVEEAAAALGYRRNAMAANLSRKRSFELGLIIPTFGGYYGDFAQVMQETVHECGYHLSVYSSSGNPEMEQRHLETLLQRRVDGLFCHGLAMTPELTRTFVGEGTPLVLFNAWGWPEDLALGAVNLDFAGGCAEAVLHLAERGCKAIFYPGRKSSKATDEQRRIGFLRGASLLPSENRPRCEIIETDGLDRGAIIRKVLEQAAGEFPVGILAFDDYSAFSLIAELRETGYDVPGQFKVAGINDQWIAGLHSPPITSLTIDLRSQARHAVHLLFQHLGESAALESIPLAERADGHGADSHEIHIPMGLIRRKSTE